MRPSWRTALGAVTVASLAACAPGDFDSGAASLTLIPDEGDTLELVHAPGLSTVRLTPPVDGEVELTFSYNDPLVEVSLRLDANQVSEGEVVPLPADPAALSLVVDYDAVRYDSGAGAAGEVTLQILQIDDESGAADVSAAFDATLVSAEGATVLVDGFIDGVVEGDAP